MLLNLEATLGEKFLLFLSREWFELNDVNEVFPMHLNGFRSIRFTEFLEVIKNLLKTRKAI